jgi:RNase H-like domain found in reverse transcriptase
LRQFVREYANLLQPLQKYLKSTTKKITWSDEGKREFEKIQNELVKMDQVYLHIPDQFNQLLLKTDASDLAIRSVLINVNSNLTLQQMSQFDDNSIFSKTQASLIGFASRILHPCETRYSLFDKEFLAIVWSVRHFSSIIRSSTRILWILTDHKILVCIDKLDLTRTRHFMWWETIGTYSFVIAHVSGEKNMIADTLTRPNVQDPINSPRQIVMKQYV